MVLTDNNREVAVCICCAVRLFLCFSWQCSFVGRLISKDKIIIKQGTCVCVHIKLGRLGSVCVCVYST